MRTAIRRALTVGAAVSFVVVMGPAASAREEITPTVITSGTPEFLTLTASNEKTIDLVTVIIDAPGDEAFGATTRQSAGWSVVRTNRRIAWSGGAVKPNEFDQWGFEIAGAHRRGTVEFNASLGYVDGTSDHVKVPVVVRSERRASRALLIGWLALGIAVVALLLALLRPVPSRRQPQQDW